MIHISPIVPNQYGRYQKVGNEFYVVCSSTNLDGTDPKTPEKRKRICSDSIRRIVAYSDFDTIQFKFGLSPADLLDASAFEIVEAYPLSVDQETRQGLNDIDGLLGIKIEAGETYITLDRIQLFRKREDQ
ncbi:MAG: hypothetical protein ABH849_00945 [Nanoarchaeota archaeon]